MNQERNVDRVRYFSAGWPKFMVGRSIHDNFPVIVIPMSNSSSPQRSSTFFRIDPEHQLLEMMQATVRRICAAEIQIRLHNDSVLLLGSVNSWYDKQYAQESLRELSGSRMIHNDLQVT